MTTLKENATGKVFRCTIGKGCVINPNGFILDRCTFPDGMVFTADKDYTNVDFGLKKQFN